MMSILDRRELDSFASSYHHNTSLPSTIHNVTADYKTYSSHHASWQDITSHSDPYNDQNKLYNFKSSRQDMKYPTSTPYIQFEKSKKNQRETISSYLEESFFPPKNKVTGRSKSEPRKSTDAIGDGDVHKKQEEYEWRLKKMLIEEAKNDPKPNKNTASERSKTSFVSSKSVSSKRKLNSVSASASRSTMADNDIESVKTDDLLQNANEFIGTTRSKKDSSPAPRSIKSGNLSENNQSSSDLINAYGTTDYHLVPEFTGSEKITSDTSGGTLGTEEGVDSQDEVTVYKARPAISYSGSNISSTLVKQPYDAHHDPDEKDYESFADSTSSRYASLAEYKSNQSMVSSSAHSENHANKELGNNIRYESDNSGNSFSSSVNAYFDGCLKELATTTHEKEIFNLDDADLIESQDEENGLERTLTPKNFIENFDASKDINSPHSSKIESDGTVEMQYRVRRSSFSSSSTLHTQDVPNKLRNSLVHISSEDRLSLVFTLHVSSTDLESLPTSDFEQNWIKRQRNRFPELEPTWNLETDLTQKSPKGSPRSKRKLTKRERMKLMLSSARSKQENIGSKDSGSSSSHSSTSGVMLDSIASASMTTEDLIYADSNGININSGNCLHSIN